MSLKAARVRVRPTCVAFCVRHGVLIHAPGDHADGKQGDVLVVEFTVAGIPCIGLNGGPHFKQTECFSFQIATDDQAETDRLWNAIVGNGGLADPDSAVARRAFETVMTMRKIDIATIEAVRRG